MTLTGVLVAFTIGGIAGLIAFMIGHYVGGGEAWAEGYDIGLRRGMKSELYNTKKKYTEWANDDTLPADDILDLLLDYIIDEEGRIDS